MSLNASLSSSLSSLSSGDDELLSDAELETDNLIKIAKSIETSVQNLKNYKPESTKKTVRLPRACKKKQVNTKAKESSNIASNDIPIEVDSIDISPGGVLILENLLDLNKKILKKLSRLESNHNQLKLQLGVFHPETGAANSLVHQESGPSKPYTYNQAVSKVANISVGTSELCDMNVRLDQVEQQSLNNTLKLSGAICIDIIEKIHSKEVTDLKQEVSSAISKVVPGTVSPDSIERVGIIGKENKHLKISVNSSECKIRILKSFKREKPDGLFVNEYLTKNRSKILYKLRQLRKENIDQIKSVYSFAGNICVKLVDSEKILFVNDDRNFDRLASKYCKTVDTNNNANDQ